MQVASKVETKSLRSLQIVGCTRISIDAVTQLLHSSPSLTHLSCDKLDRVLEQLSYINTSHVYKLQNFEHNVSNDEEDSEKFLETMSNICPDIRTAKLNINQV